MVCTIQDDLIPTLMAEYPNDLVQDANGDITLEYQSAAELETAFDDC